MSTEEEPKDPASGQLAWARAHLREYLLRRLSEEEEDRVIDALAIDPTFASEIDEAEEELIASWLDERMPAADRDDFRRLYAEGSERNRSKLMIYQALRSPELKRRFPPLQPVPSPAPVPFRARRMPILAVAGIVAALLAFVFSLLFYNQLRQNDLLSKELAKAHRQLPPGPHAPGPQVLVEQPAGLNPDGGLLLEPSDSGKRLALSAVPAKLTWGPVGDDHARYRIRVQFADGRELSSAPLTPRQLQVEYAPPDLASRPFPWQVTVLTIDAAGGKVDATYTLVKP